MRNQRLNQIIEFIIENEADDIGPWNVHLQVQQNME